MIRVLVADDNAIVRRGLVALLSDLDGFAVVAEAGDGREAVALAQQTKPDIALLDIRMPIMDGVETAAALRDRCKVLMVTYSEDEHLVLGAIQAGASGYLIHGHFEIDELESHLHRVMEGDTVLSPSLATVVFDALRRIPSSYGKRDEEEGLRALTGREREIMNLVARGMTNASIGAELFLTERTVKNHLTNVYGKLGVHSRAEAIVAWLGTKRQVGSNL